MRQVEDLAELLVADEPSLMSISPSACREDLVKLWMVDELGSMSPSACNFSAVDEPENVTEVTDEPI